METSVLRVKAILNDTRQTSNLSARSHGIMVSLSKANPFCLEDRWEYSNENTRFQIDRPK